MQSQAKLESEIAKLKEQNEKTKDEGNSLQEKLLMQVQINQFPEVNRSLNVSWVFATHVYIKFKIYLIHVKYLIVQIKSLEESKAKLEEEKKGVENKWKENETVIGKITQELNQTKQDSEKEKVIYHQASLHKTQWQNFLYCN